jgi:hypothetical protein
MNSSYTRLKEIKELLLKIKNNILGIKVLINSSNNKRYFTLNGVKIEKVILLLRLKQDLGKAAKIIENIE